MDMKNENSRIPVYWRKKESLDNNEAFQELH